VPQQGGSRDKNTPEARPQFPADPRSPGAHDSQEDPGGNQNRSARNKNAPSGDQQQKQGQGKAQDKKQEERRQRDPMEREEGNKRAKKIAIGVGMVFLILLAIGVIPRLIRNHELAAEKKKQQDTTPTATVVLAQGAFPAVEVELSGTTSALTEAPLLARADGFLVKRLVDIGDRVHAGQLLAVVASPDLDQEVEQAKAAVLQSQSALEQSQASLEQARATKGLTQITAERWARLQQKGAVSRQENDTNQTSNEAQSATVSAMEANVRVANHAVASNQASLDRYLALQNYEQVRAPFDGIVTERDLDVGALISNGTTVLYRVAQIDVLRTYIDVPQLNAPAVKLGQHVTVSFAEYPGRGFDGSVTRISDSLDPNTRTMVTEVQLPNPDRALLPGMYGTVKFTVPTMGSAVIIPGESLIVRAQGTLVAVIDDQNTVHFKKVDVGHDYGNTLEIVGGLTAGEKVVANPDDSVQEGAQLRPVLSKQEPESPPATGTGIPGNAPPKAQGQTQNKQGSASQQSQQGNGSQNKRQKFRNKNKNGSID
jgi:RND family efflux transporter MFP subunit